MPIDTVFLDAGGVLVFPNWIRVRDALARHGVTVDAGTLAAADARAKRTLDVPSTFVGTTDRERGWPYFNLVLRAAGIPLGPVTDAALAELHVYHDEHNLWELVPPDVPPALDRLRGMGFRLAVISNANGTLHRCLDRVGLTDRFEVILDSQIEGVEKPDPRLFEIALTRLGASPGRTVHVGDLYHVDVAGARRAALHAVLLDAADLYAGVDCPRVATLDGLADSLRDGTWVPAP